MVQKKSKVIPGAIKQINKIQKDLKNYVSSLQRLESADKETKHKEIVKILNQFFEEFVRLSYVFEGKKNVKDMTDFSSNAIHLLIQLSLKPDIHKKWISKSDILYKINKYSTKGLDVSSEQFNKGILELINAGFVEEMKISKEQLYSKNNDKFYKISIDEDDIPRLMQRHYYYVPKN